MDTDKYETSYSLIQRLKLKEDVRAWEGFLEHYRPFIFFLLNKMSISPDEQEDLAQEIVLKLYQNLEAYSHQKGKFRNWLGTVIRNSTLNYLDREKRLRDKNERFLNSLETIQQQKESELEGSIQREWQEYLLELALKNLSQILDSNIIECFKMTLENVPVEEISNRLGVTVSTVYTLRKRIKPRLIKEMKRLREDLEF